MQKAVFLDRDGVLIRQVYHLHRMKDLKVYSYSARSIEKLRKLGFKIIVISNQGAVALGLCDEAFVRKTNLKIKNTLAKEGAKIDAFYYCPHRPAGKIKKYTKKCKCRKPEIGMLKEARRKFNLDLRKSYVVGDMTADIRMGKKAGCRTILVKTGFAGRDKRYKVKADHTVKNLLHAANLIAKPEERNV